MRTRPEQEQEWTQRALAIEEHWAEACDRWRKWNDDWQHWEYDYSRWRDNPFANGGRFRQSPGGFEMKPMEPHNPEDPTLLAYSALSREREELQRARRGAGPPAP